MTYLKPLTSGGPPPLFDFIRLRVDWGAGPAKRSGVSFVLLVLGLWD